VAFRGLAEVKGVDELTEWKNSECALLEAASEARKSIEKQLPQYESLQEGFSTKKSISDQRKFVQVIQLLTHADYLAREAKSKLVSQGQDPGCGL
jgi:hypothetical protein